MMDADEHVYCTNCAHFWVAETDDGELIPSCTHEDDCNIWDCVDSKPYPQRPRYEAAKGE